MCLYVFTGEPQMGLLFYIMDLFGTAYLNAIKEKVKQDAPSKAVMDALRELQRINADQAKQIVMLKETIESLKLQNAHLDEYLQHIREDHEEYRLSKQARQQKSINTEIQLRRHIERLEEERNRILGQSQYRDYVVDNRAPSRSTKTDLQNSPRPRSPQQSIHLRAADASRISNESGKALVQDVIQLQKQMLQLNQCNQRLMKAILNSGGDQIIDIRTQMRNNNRQIAKLKTILADYKSREQAFLEHTSR